MVLIQHRTGSLVNLVQASQLRTLLTPKIKLQDAAWQCQGGESRREVFHSSEMLSLTNFALIGTFEVLKVMHDLGVELDADTYADYVFKNFADSETARAQLKVSLH